MKKPHLSPLLLASILIATAAGTARAQDGAPAESTTSGGSTSSGGGASFGQAGQWVYSIAGENEFPLSISKTGDSPWNLTLRPGVDYFLVRSVSIGGIVALHKDGGRSDIGVGARAGYNLPITSLVSFWARAGVFVNNYNINNGPNGVETTIGVNAPFLFHILPHAFAGVGPFFSLPVQNSDGMASKDATYGLTAIVGGWL